MTVIVDQASRGLVGFAVFRRLPSSQQVQSFLDLAPNDRSSRSPNVDLFYYHALDTQKLLHLDLSQVSHTLVVALFFGEVAQAKGVSE